MYGCVFNEDMLLVQQMYYALLESQQEKEIGRSPVVVVPMCRELLLLAGEIEPGQEVM